MKYTLIKKWHPSQVEEVGHVFEEESDTWYNHYHSIKHFFKDFPHIPQYISSHEIALLCEAGFLKKEEVQDKSVGCSPGDCVCPKLPVIKEKCNHEPGDISFLSMPPQWKCKKCGEMYTEEAGYFEKDCPHQESLTKPDFCKHCGILLIEPADPQLELWSNLSENQFKHILAKYNAEILNTFQDEYLIEKGSGCEKILFPVLEKTIESFTQKSAEEALKRLLEPNK